MKNRRLYFLIPVFNEEENISDLMESFSQLTSKLKDYSCQFFLLNDGSTDKTVEQFELHSKRHNLETNILSLDKNQGPGAAFRLGFNHIKKLMMDEDLLITMEGDNTSNVDLIQIMIDRLIRENYEIVLASAYTYGGGFQSTSAFRMLLSHFGNGFTKFFLKIHGIHTLSSFFRLFNYSSIQKLDEKYGDNIFSLNGFESVVEVLAKCTFLKIKISEVPMIVDWTKRKGKSKMKVIKTIIAYFNLYLHAKKIVFCNYVTNKNS